MKRILKHVNFPQRWEVGALSFLHARYNKVRSFDHCTSPFGLNSCPPNKYMLFKTQGIVVTSVSTLATCNYTIFVSFKKKKDDYVIIHGQKPPLGEAVSRRDFLYNSN